MKTFLKITALSLVLGLTASPKMSSAQISGEVHINIGPPPLQVEVRPARPDPEYIWVGGYHEYDPGARSYHWHPGRWDRPPSQGARWVAPRYNRHGKEYQFQPGRWKEKGEGHGGKGNNGNGNGNHGRGHKDQN